MLQKLVAFAFMTVSVGPARPADGAEWKALFGAEPHAGWAQCGPGKFTLENGVATAAGGMGLWWFTQRVFTNFLWRGEFKQEHPVRFRNLRVQKLP